MGVFPLPPSSSVASDAQRGLKRQVQGDPLLKDSCQRSELAKRRRSRIGSCQLGAPLSQYHPSPPNPQPLPRTVGVRLHRHPFCGTRLPTISSLPFGEMLFAGASGTPTLILLHVGCTWFRHPKLPVPPTVKAPGGFPWAVAQLASQPSFHLFHSLSSPPTLKIPVTPSRFGLLTFL